MQSKKSKTVKVAIIGAGFCGLATAWHLSKLPLEITLIDSLGIGQGASGVAAGLLHKYAGLHAKKNFEADEGFLATKKLLAVAEQALGEKVFQNAGLLRPAISDEQHKDYKKSLETFSDITWMTVDQCQRAIPGLKPVPGIFVDTALAVDSGKYLKGLWKACESKGVLFLQKTISSLKELTAYQYLVITAGSGSKIISELTHLPLSNTKGQILEFKWPAGLPPLPFPINSQAYLLMTEDNTSCIAGSTFEKNYENDLPNKEIAINEILPKLAAFFPHFSKNELIDCKAGIRTSTPSHKPLLKMLTNNTWVLTGMGSKGLLYHALYAEKLSKELANSLHSKSLTS